MKLDIFTEIQDPRPWTPDHEHRRIMEALEQAKLADEMGYGTWWQVEHHGGEEFSLSSAPEILLTAISQHTKNIRLGHSAALAPYRFNHPIRIAERAAFLDHLSNGRVELGLARSTIPEWRTFNIAADEARDQMQQAFEMIPKMWTQERFSWKSQYFDIKDVPIVPKPLQKPHPALWQACSSPASFEQAGRNGVGALGVTLWAPPEQVKAWIDLYRKAIAECKKPVGEFINDKVAFFTFVHCADTDEEAMRNGAATAAAWYTNRSFTFFEAKEQFLQVAAEQERRLKDPAGSALLGQFLNDEKARSDGRVNRAQIVIGRIMQGEEVSPEEVYDALAEQDSLIVGSPETCLRKMQVYADLGIDRLMCFQQVGQLPHDKVMKSIRLIGELIPKLEGKSQPTVLHGEGSLSAQV
ncbi:LLM class flavin-dependent oxidoreductase [Nannocystis sp. ILAH1]|uniref:LLM class flavin-dependent oxidoreductase n=1 Tax=unclassified Nannocystis TaxID=2627009 RepID=UPI00227122B9|nr:MULTISPECIES: LLM class flavin-dependent oxidoreductase [unclassified Nannocystis]MCY0992912.1 LLM class flavin-dependent oxidoreductase [Nannocystis sp. ILAH1]MCY1066250.1 LLM class flavin-dependent oxidoreductase [Nannocystis sp. RBIL2]